MPPASTRREIVHQHRPKLTERNPNGHAGRSLKRQFDASANGFLRSYEALPRHFAEQYTALLR